MAETCVSFVSFFSDCMIYIIDHSMKWLGNKGGQLAKQGKLSRSLLLFLLLSAPPPFFSSPSSPNNPYASTVIWWIYDTWVNGVFFPQGIYMHHTRRWVTALYRLTEADDWGFSQVFIKLFALLGWETSITFTWHIPSKPVQKYSW